MVTMLNVVSDENSQHMIVGEKINSLSHDSSTNVKGKLGFSINIASILQRTLEIEQLITLFSQQIKPAIPHDGISFHNDPVGLVFKFGKKSNYKNHYRLLVNGEPLGEITLYRSWEFSGEDKTIFEYTLCGLVYPLRNAIMYRKALFAAHKDALTGVYNRSTLEESLDREVKLASRYDRPLSLTILDIDNFKAINDNYGHSVGDIVIVETIKRVMTCIRSTDIVFRYGGEEFVILLSNTDIDGASQLAERIRRAVCKTPVIHDNDNINVTISLGTAQMKPNEINANFFTRADAALYQAKGGGKNQVRIAD